MPRTCSCWRPTALPGCWKIISWRSCCRPTGCLRTKWTPSLPNPTATAGSTTSLRSSCASTRSMLPRKKTSRPSSPPPGRARAQHRTTEEPRRDFLARQPQAVSTQPGQRDVEHVGLGREVEEQLIASKAELAREPLLHTLEQIGIAGWPVAGFGRQLGRGNVESAFGEPSLAQRARQSRLIVFLRLV